MAILQNCIFEPIQSKLSSELPQVSARQNPFENGNGVTPGPAPSFPVAVSRLFPCIVRFASKPAMLTPGNDLVSLRFPFPRRGC
jgi:hypothetical protein